MTNILRKIGARIVFAFTGYPPEMKKSPRRATRGLGASTQPKRFDWHGAGAGSPGPRNNYGTKSGPGF
ncbi:conserved protein of unknown function (plasmid) [Paraburkholderia dioscoreae]|uniref:Uncharacterized protein n=1 Tax=Paraburkholderia dioscoreae TaxID=2604047 RepID=A0A5Q4ZQN4_9BURK|nr:conserved protein of unknown function [Paraburkholderia dioscoreae]